MTPFVMVIFVIICILLIIVVLLQKGRGGGLGGILGGGGGQSAFGTRTGDVFTWITIVLVGVFLLLAIGATKHFRGGEPEKIDMPVFYPPPGPITKAKPVTITCRPQKADIFYTIGPIDKPLPDPTRDPLRKYDTPIRIEPGMKLKARAYLTGWKESDVQVGEYSVKTASTSPATNRADAAPTPPAEKPKALR